MVLIDFGSLMILAFLAVGALKVIRSAWEKLVLSFLLALGLKSLFLFGLIVFHVRPDKYVQLGLSLAALMGVAGWVMIGRRALGARGSGSWGGEDSPPPRAVAGVLAALFILSAVNAFFFPITEADGIWYHIKGMVYYHEARFDSPAIITQFRQYPPLVPLLFAGWMGWEGELVKMIFPFIYLALVVLFYFRVRDQSGNARNAAAFALVLGTTPYFWWHSVLPFLDLTAACLYSLGALYWFSLIRNLLHEDPKASSRTEIPLSLLSGIFFGLSAWTRLEFVLYEAIPLLLTFYVLNRTALLDRARKKKIFLALAVPALIFPSLWFLTLLSFESPWDHRVVAVSGACAALWLLVPAFLTGRIRCERRVLVPAGLLAGIFFLLFILVRGPGSVSPGTSLLIAGFRTLAVHVFYSFTVLTAVILVLEKRTRLAGARKLMALFLIFFLAIHFAIFSYADPKWENLATYFMVTFVYPGNSVNLSDTRGMLAFYPVLLFFVAGSPGWEKVWRGKGMRLGPDFLYGIAALNLCVLLVIFIYPRARFIAAHWKETPRMWKESPGSWDMPNQFAETYRVAHRVRDLTLGNATVLLPPGDRLEGSFRSAAVQVLYPRRIVFGGEEAFGKLLKAGRRIPHLYFVYGPKWHSEVCGEKPRARLNDAGWGMCRLDD